METCFVFEISCIPVDCLHLQLYTIKMFGIGKVFNVVERSLLCFDKKYSKNYNIVKYYYNLK